MARLSLYNRLSVNPLCVWLDACRRRLFAVKENSFIRDSVSLNRTRYEDMNSKYARCSCYVKCTFITCRNSEDTVFISFIDSVASMEKLWNQTFVMHFRGHLDWTIKICQKYHILYNGSCLWARILLEIRLGYINSLYDRKNLIFIDFLIHVKAHKVKKLLV